MRKVVLFHMISLDGVVEEPGNWMFDVDEAIFANIAEVTATQDAVLLGRGSYDYWVGHWPTSDLEPFASFINGVTKYVYSHTELDGVWPGSVAVTEPPREHVGAHKAQAGGDIGIHASITLAQDLLAAGLVDELRFVQVPTLAGKGRKLFERDDDRQRLDLVSAVPTPSGCVLLHYRIQ